MFPALLFNSCYLSAQLISGVSCPGAAELRFTLFVAPGNEVRAQPEITARVVSAQEISMPATCPAAHTD